MPGPFGLPHSCAEMLSPSGVVTASGLFFNSWPKPACDTVTNKTVAHSTREGDVRTSYPPSIII